MILEQNAIKINSHFIYNQLINISLLKKDNVDIHSIQTIKYSNNIWNTPSKIYSLQMISVNLVTTNEKIYFPFDYLVATKKEINRNRHSRKSISFTDIKDIVDSYNYENGVFERHLYRHWDMNRYIKEYEGLKSKP